MEYKVRAERDATDKSPADNASKILTIESLFCVLLDLFCLLFGKTLNVPVLVWVLVWFWFGLLC